MRVPANSFIIELMDLVERACRDACSSRHRATTLLVRKLLGTSLQGLLGHRLGQAEGCSERGPACGRELSGLAGPVVDRAGCDSCK